MTGGFFQGVLLVHLPPYCPELNPIELGFGVMKMNLRRTQALASPDCDPKSELEKDTYKAFSMSLLAKAYHRCGYKMPQGWLLFDSDIYSHVTGYIVISCIFDICDKHRHFQWSMFCHTCFVFILYVQYDWTHTRRSIHLICFRRK